MKTITFLIQSFGFVNIQDFYKSTFGAISSQTIKWSGILAFLELFLKQYLGINLLVYFCFSLLIVAEYLTGVRAAGKQGQKFQSRKAGRMIFKIGVYTFILFLLYSFQKGIQAPSVLGLELNPFSWLYNVVLIAIVFQLIISFLENLGRLGYKESKTIAGIVLRKFNTWFDFDGKAKENKSLE